MDVREVTISVHEKRNHPHEFGHYDCEVRLTAEVSPDQSVDQTILELRNRAKYHVREQCDAWIAAIEAERKKQQELDGLRGEVRDAEYECRRLTNQLKKAEKESPEDPITF